MKIPPQAACARHPSTSRARSTRPQCPRPLPFGSNHIQPRRIESSVPRLHLAARAVQGSFRQRASSMREQETPCPIAALEPQHSARACTQSRRAALLATQCVSCTVPSLLSAAAYQRPNLSACPSPTPITPSHRPGRVIFGGKGIYKPSQRKDTYKHACIVGGYGDRKTLVWVAS